MHVFEAQFEGFLENPECPLRVDSVEKVDIFAGSVFFQGKLVFVFSVFNVVFVKYWLRVSNYSFFDALFKFRAQGYCKSVVVEHAILPAFSDFE